MTCPSLGGTSPGHWKVQKQTREWPRVTSLVRSGRVVASSFRNHPSLSARVRRRAHESWPHVPSIKCRLAEQLLSCPVLLGACDLYFLLEG